MGRLASELLARALTESAEPTPASPLRWTSADLGVPRVDLEDKEAMRAAMDERP